MSNVTTLIICCSFGDDMIAIKELNAWLGEQTPKQMPLARLNEHFAGSKWPEWQVFGAAYNHLDVNDFISFFLSRTWFGNYDVMLIIKPQDIDGYSLKPCGPEMPWDDAAGVYRFPDGREWRVPDGGGWRPA